MRRRSKEIKDKEAVLRAALRITAIIVSGGLIVALTVLWHPMSGESESGSGWFLLWPLCWFGSIAVFIWNVPVLVLETRYKAPKSKYDYDLFSWGICIVCGLITGAASSGATEVLMSNVDIPHPATEWMIRVTFLGLGMAALALLHPAPTPRSAKQGSSFVDQHRIAMGMASRTPDLEDVDNRLHRIERSLGIGSGESIEQRLNTIERSIR